MADHTIFTPDARNGERVTVFRDLTGRVRAGQRVRVVIAGTRTDEVEPSGASVAADVKAALTEHFSGMRDFRAPRVGEVTEDAGGFYTVGVDLAIDGVTLRAWDDVEDLRRAVRRSTYFLNTFGQTSGIYFTDLEDPDPEVITRVSGDYSTDYAGIVGESIGETVRMAASGAGSLVGSVGSGFFGGLGLVGSIILIVLVLVALFVLFLYMTRL